MKSHRLLTVLFSCSVAVSASAAPLIYDLDLDGDADADDYFLISKNIQDTWGTGSAFDAMGVGNGPTDGDFDGDGDIDGFDVSSYLSNYTGTLGGPPPVGESKLKYDPLDGSLTIDTNAETINGFFIYYERVGISFPSDTPTPINGVRALLPSLIADVNHAHGQSGILPLALALEVGLSETAFVERFNSGDYIAVYSNDASGFKQSFNLVYVPEPASLTLFAFGGVALTRRRQ